MNFPHFVYMTAARIKIKFLAFIFFLLAFLVFVSNIEAAPTPIPLACNYLITGTVYEDANNDGQFDRSPPQAKPFVDKSLAGWKVTLYQNGKKIKKAISNKAGSYVFTKLCAGTYKLIRQQKPGWTAVEPLNKINYTIKITNRHVKYVDFGNIPILTPVPVSTPVPTPAQISTPTPIVESCPDGNTNIALGKSVTVGNAGNYADINIITNGRRDPAVDGSTFLIGTNPSLTIDLGKVCSISKINLEMLFQINRQRIYHNVQAKISEDQENWTTVFNSNKDGEFITSEKGKDIVFSPKKARFVMVSSNGATIVNEDEKPADNNWIEVSVYGFSDDIILSTPTPTPTPTLTPRPTSTPTPMPTLTPTLTPTPTPTPAPDFSWSNAANLPTSLYWAGAAVVSDKIYVPIGLGKICSVFIYSPSSNAWSYGPNVPWCGLSASGKVAAVGSKLFIISSGDLHIYDTEMGSWTRGKSAPEPIENLGSANGKIYMIGRAVSGAANNVYEYYPLSNSWNEKTPMPTPRVTVASAVINNLIYVAGGKGENGIVSTLEVYDPANNTWNTKASMPTARTAANAVAVNGKLYVIGGSINNVVATDIVEEYDPLTDKWTRKKGISIARAAATSAIVNGKVYIIGGVGANGEAISSVEEGYIPSASAITPIPTPAPVPQLVKDLEEFTMELLKIEDRIVLYERGGYGISNGVRGIFDPANFQSIYGFSPDIIKKLAASDQDSLKNLGYNFATSKGKIYVSEIKDILTSYRDNRNSGISQTASAYNAPNALPAFPPAPSLYPAPGVTQSDCGTVAIGGRNYERIPFKFYGQAVNSQTGIMYLPGTNTPYEAWEISQEEFIRIAKLKYVDHYGGMTLYEKIQSENPSVLQPNACTDLVWNGNDPWKISNLEEAYRLANDPTQCNIGTALAPLYLPCGSAGHEEFKKRQAAESSQAKLEEIAGQLVEIQEIISKIKKEVSDLNPSLDVKETFAGIAESPAVKVEVVDKTGNPYLDYDAWIFSTSKLTSGPSSTVSSLAHTDFGKMILPIDFFDHEISGHNGDPIPLYIPYPIDGSNAIREQDGWHTVAEKIKTDIDLDKLDLLNTFANISDPIIVELSKLGKAWDIISYKITIQQKNSEPNFRAIIQMGDPKSKTFVRANADKTIAVILNDMPGKGGASFRSVYSDFLKERYGLPVLNGSDYYTQNVIVDASHKDDEFIYYLSFENNSIVATPKTYSSDRIDILHKHGFFLWQKEIVFSVTSYSYDANSYVSNMRFPIFRNNQLGLPSDVYKLDSFWKSTGIQLQ